MCSDGDGQRRNTCLRNPLLAAVTETDKASEAAVVGALSAAFPQHAILGEEGGVLGNVESDYLWWVLCITST